MWATCDSVTHTWLRDIITMSQFTIGQFPIVLNVSPREIQLRVGEEGHKDVCSLVEPYKLNSYCCGGAVTCGFRVFYGGSYLRSQKIWATFPTLEIHPLSKTSSKKISGQIWTFGDWKVNCKVTTTKGRVTGLLTGLDHPRILYLSVFFHFLLLRGG